MRNAALHVVSSASTKTADGLIEPKLVLAWLINAIGGPGFIIGLLVPLREAGALLPQLLLAGPVAQASRRKYFWVAGSVVQGLAACGMAAAALLLPGTVASWCILGCLAVLALARSACSVSHKDVMASTLEKGQRGRVMGVAGTVSAVTVLAFSAAVAFGVIPREPAYIAGAVGVAGLFWLLGAAVFSLLREEAAEGDERSSMELADFVEPLREDPEFLAYIATRALLISTALAPPFLVMLGSSGGEGASLGNLGLLLVASSLAAIVSSYAWGAMSDWSSRRTLMLAGALAGICLGGAAIFGPMVEGRALDILLAGFLFVGQIAYQGARSGRKTHLTDMDTHGQKAVYTALSNSLIGIMLLAGGGFGLLADAAGPAGVLAVLAAMSVMAVLAATRLSEVQHEEG